MTVSGLFLLQLRLTVQVTRKSEVMYHGLTPPLPVKLSVDDLKKKVGSSLLHHPTCVQGILATHWPRAFG